MLPALTEHPAGGALCERVQRNTSMVVVETLPFGQGDTLALMLPHSQSTCERAQRNISMVVVETLPFGQGDTLAFMLPHSQSTCERAQRNISMVVVETLPFSQGDIKFPVTFNEALGTADVKRKEFEGVVDRGSRRKGHPPAHARY